MATLVVNLTDETGTGKVLASTQVVFEHSLVSVAQIIEKRVTEEVARHNRERNQNFRGLVQPIQAEQTLNGTVRKVQFKPVDAGKQVAVAKEAFRKNAFFLLIDNIQAESLEQTFVLHSQSTISFVKLTPLVGG